MVGNPLLTKEQVESWVAERAEVASQYASLGLRLEDLDRKLAAVQLLLPTALAESLLYPENVSSRAEASFTELSLMVLAEASRGLTPSEVRNILIDDPVVGDRAQGSHNGVTNALSRLLSTKRVIKKGAKYYLPATYERIVSGELEEDDQPEESTTFNAIMHEVMRAFGLPFVAKDAMAAGKAHKAISEKLEEQPSRVYSWLSRELGRGNLARDDDGKYYYPSQRDGALNGKAVSAPYAGGVAPPPTDNRPGFDLIG